MCTIKDESHVCLAQSYLKVHFYRRVTLLIFHSYNSELEEKLFPWTIFNRLSMNHDKSRTHREIFSKYY